MEILINGLARGAIYALVALGYTMVYGILGMINFAHGEIFMLGMFAAVFGIGLVTTLLPAPLWLVLVAGILFAMAISAGFGYLNERIAYRKLRRSHILAPLTSAIGLSIILQNFVMLAVTKDKVDFPRHHAEWFAAQYPLLGASISRLQIAILVVALVLMAALFWLIQRTRLGIALRATSQDRTMAGLVGIPVDRAISTTFIVGSALAAVAGVMVSMYQGIMRFDSGYAMGLKAFTAAVLGGIGNIPGAVLGAFLIGLVEDFTAFQLGSDWKNTTIFVILVVVLILRPRGLLGERVADKV